MTTWKVAITHRAQAELEAAYEWWATNRSSSQALQWYNGFIDAIRSLSENPSRYPLAAESNFFPYQIRQLNYGVSRPTHRAVFTIRKRLVLVIRVRPLAQTSITPDD